jgi:hypothetical protein
MLEDHFFLPLDLFFLDFLEDFSFSCNKRFMSLTSSIKKALVILEKVVKKILRIGTFL